MDKNERLFKILDVLRTEGNASTKYLANLLDVSEATIRRDLKNLSEEDTFPVNRVHGGIIYSLEKIGSEPMFDIKLSQKIEEKKKIAKFITDLVDDRDTIILDSGTTCYYIARELVRKKGLKIVCVDIKVAGELAKYPTIQTILIGGEIRTGYFSVGGEMAVRFLSEIRAEKGFIATDGWDLNGSYNSSTFEVGVKKAIIKNSLKTYLIADSTKYGKVALIKVADLDQLDGLIINKPLQEDVVDALKQRNFDVFLI